jgi:sulfur-carrier protein
MSVTVELRLFASLKKYLPGESACRYTVEPGMPLSALLDQLCIPKDQVKLIFINGAREDAGVLLQGGERVGVFPPIGGG